MAYCPKCENNYPIVTSTSGSSYSVPVTTEKYSSGGKYIGYEEGETYRVEIKTLPRCSNCYSIFEFPNALSKEEFFYAKRNKLLKRWRSKKPFKPGLAKGIFGAVISGVVVGVITAALTAEATIGVLVGVGVSFGILWIGVSEHRDDLKKYEDKIARWNKKLNELKSLTYSDENYERLIRPQLKISEPSEKHKEIWKRIKEAKEKYPERWEKLKRLRRMRK